VTVEVATSGGALCSASRPVTTNVTVRAAYGNLLPLGAINSIAHTSGKTGQAHVNLTIADNHGTKESVMCNNHGVCDHATGHCKCAQLVVPGTTIFR
jgi:hypothetical protein